MHFIVLHSKVQYTIQVKYYRLVHDMTTSINAVWLCEDPHVVKNLDMDKNDGYPIM